MALADGVSLHKSAAWGDYNNEGFLDLVLKDGVGGEEENGGGAIGLHYLFKNNGNSNHFLKVNLRGLQSELHGLGARVTVTFRSADLDRLAEFLAEIFQVLVDVFGLAEKAGHEAVERVFHHGHFH